MAGEIKSLFLPGPSGKLEALLNTGSAQATHAALVAHPHPLYGGTMHNKVVFSAMKALNNLGFPALRFNFRGAGLSEGTHDQGRGEVEDVRAALDWLEREFHLPIIFAGFSFGAATGLRICCPDKRVAGVISLGTPVEAEGRFYTYSFLRECRKPKLFVSGGHDEYGPLPELQKVIDSVPEPKQFVIVEGVGHFFEGKLDQVRSLIEQWVKSELQPQTKP
ncbi:MAG TPA: alpha/beta fold hydrolase [Terriglobales bacterium]|nr:alpha/beta fold hydrolase [Terriglobales bacterium]